LLAACGVAARTQVSSTVATMNYGSHEEYQPVAWLRGHPLYVAHLIVLGFVVSMIVTSIFMFAKAEHLLGGLYFTSEAVLRGQVWRVATYGLVNEPSLGFAIDMLMIVWFGRELEKFFGRRTFLWLYASLYLLSPLLLTLVGIWQPSELAGEHGAFALFIAFATLYPNVPVIFNLLAKWVAFILVGIYTLSRFSSRDLFGLLTLWGTVGYAFAFVRFHQGHFNLPKFKFPSSGPKLRVVPEPKPKKSSSPRTVSDSTMAEIDALLDKIATSGIASLTPAERAKLDAARDDLLKKSASRH
jgi:hypothetical protein